MCYLTAGAVGPTYRAEGSIVLVPPKDVEDPTANRFLALGSLTPAVDVLTRALNADETRALVKRTAPEGTYQTAVDDATSAPVLVVTSEAPSARGAAALVDAVLTQAPASLSAVQSALSINRSAEITSIPLSRDEPDVSQKSRVRAVGALGVVCLGGSIALIGALDGILLARRARKERKRKGDDIKPRNSVPADDDDHTWLENELATISLGVDDARPAKSQTSRDGE